MARYGLLVAILLFATCQYVVAEPPVDFAKDVLPLLSDRCALCHGPDSASRQADLRLDIPAAIDAESQSGGLSRIITPGDAQASELFRRITSDDPDEIMPPPESNLALTAKEVARIRDWINAGAEWKRHWSLREIVRPAIPDPANPNSITADNPNHPIDLFINERLASEGVTPSPIADRYSLLRRLTLDLTGLPPSVSDLQKFLDDDSPLAYERQVDRLLASPAYGERMAIPWLDAARYADTYGYQSDVFRDVWQWRDWVIDAFRNNMPYDQFLTWQLAGDLIPHPTTDSQLATTFNRLHRQTNEGGSVEEEFRAEYVSDRVNTLGTAVLGLTLECARCHDHKYDPISQKQYYELAAFFANIDESGLYSHFTNYVPTPVFNLPSDIQQQQLNDAAQAVDRASDAYRAAVQQAKTLDSSTKIRWSTEDLFSADGIHLRDELAHYDFGTTLDALDFANRCADGPAAQPTGSVSPVQSPSGNAVQLDGENGLQTPLGGDWDWWQPFTISLRLNPQQFHQRAVIWHRSKAWTDAASCGYELLIEEGRLSAALIHFWPGDAIRVRTVDPIPVQHWSHVTVTSDGSGKASGLKIYVDGVAVNLEIVRDNLFRTIRGGGANELAVGNRFRDRGFKGGQVDDLRIFSRDLAAAEVATIAQSESQSATESSLTPQSIALAHHLSSNEQVRQSRQALLQSRQQLASIRDSIPAIMTMREVPGLHDTFILERGRYDAPREKVSAHIPETLGPFPSDYPRNRLGLAQWLTESHPDRRHPLVARVAVNRIWQMFFDNGLVSTPEDFGLQGQPPSHPELLEYLADTFVDQGWDVKRLIRLIVTSQSYQRSAHCNPADRERDPDNVLLARGPLSRLPIESIRDCALSTAGLLDFTSGGPPVRPYQPAGLWEEKSSASYVRQVGAGSHRRSLYTYWKRTSPPPSMLIFDAPGREVCVAGRTITQTPLQALVLLNDEQFVEAARGIAFGLLTNSSNNDESSTAEAQARELFLRVLGRPASDEEVRVVLTLFSEQRDAFNADTSAADKYLAIGDFNWRASAHADKIVPAELAAWTVTAQTLMNLQEWVTQ